MHKKETNNLERDSLLSMILELGGELFVLKAEMQRMKMALEEQKLLTSQNLKLVADSSEFALWLAHEEKQFGEHLMNSYTQAEKVGQVHQYLSGIHPVMEK
jgi:hypothetical protein